MPNVSFVGDLKQAPRITESFSLSEFRREGMHTFPDLASKSRIRVSYLQIYSTKFDLTYYFYF